MYEVILDQIIEDIQGFGIIDTIVISEDYYSTLSKKEVFHLDSFLTDGIKWAIVSDRKEYFCFRYSHEPIEFEDEDPWWM